MFILQELFIYFRPPNSKNHPSVPRFFSEKNRSPSSVFLKKQRQLFGQAARLLDLPWFWVFI